MGVISMGFALKYCHMIKLVFVNTSVLA